MYQGFRPTADELVAVDLRLFLVGLFPTEGTSTSIRIHIGGPTDPVLGVASAMLHESGLTHFDFDPPLPLTPGNLYAIELHIPSETEWQLEWALTGDNPYPGGPAWGCTGNPIPDIDFNFITYASQSPPVAHDNGYSTNEDTVLNVAAPGVLGNDTDADGDTLSAVLVSGPAHGTLTFNTLGSFTYIPNADFFGSDSFTYKANDGIDDSNVATVGIAVLAVNDGPVAIDDAYSTVENTALNVPAPGVLGNDSDVDGDALAAALVSGPANGTLVLGGDGSFSYTPNMHFSGSDSFSYQACDSGLFCSTATVTITVADSSPGNGPPSDPGGAVPDNPGNAGGNSNPHACGDNPGRANEHRPGNIPPCR
jgi:hypothetical protein